MREAVCAKCGSKFDATAQRTCGGIGHDIKKQIQSLHKAPEAWIDESAEVRCPGGYVGRMGHP